MRRLIILVVILVAVLGIWGIAEQYSPNILQFLNKEGTLPASSENVKVVKEESIVIDVVKNVGPSVVTIASEPQQTTAPFDFGPFFFFGPLPDEQQPQEKPDQPQDIGSGFVVSTDGLIVSNKHVVANADIKYFVITSTDKRYDVQRIYRDPLNDIAILKINPNQHTEEKLRPVELGDSSKLQAGQFVIAIGTALGEFRNTVTTGVISGLGRGVTAGNEFQGFVERLDNVIQTDAAINPGNSGGPLLNSSAQVIGVNTAIAASGQNIGFALPINVVKESLKNFNETGQFNRPYLGVAYRMINKDVALLNKVPQGAYIQRVVPGSSADKAGIRQGDIITKIDGEQLEGENGLANVIAKKKIGDRLTMTVWRSSGMEDGGQTTDITLILEAAPSQ